LIVWRKIETSLLKYEDLMIHPEYWGKKVDEYLNGEFTSEVKKDLYLHMINRQKFIENVQLKTLLRQIFRLHRN